MSPPTTNAKRASTRNKTMPPSVTATEKGGGDAVLTTTTTSSPPAATSMTQEHKKAAAIGGVPPLHPPPIATITTTTNTTTKKKGRRPKFPHPPPTNAISKNENETHGKEQQQQKAVGSQDQQQQQQSSFFPRLPSTQCDEEYAKFMKSILGDDQTICTFNTRVTMKREDMNASSSIVVGSTFETLEDDDLSYRLTSDEEEDDDEDEDDDTQDDDGEDDNVDGEDGMMELGENDEEDDKISSQVVGTSSSFVDYDDDGQQQQQQDLFEVLIGEIEDLMEEDQQAAFMTSLAETSGKGGELLSDASARWNGTGFKGGGASGGVAVPTMSKGQVGNTGAVMGTVQQRAITTPGISTKKKKSTTTVINTPPPLSSASGGVGRTTDGDDSTLPGGGAIEVPAVRREQLARLRSIMARHHQLLLQQATLVVRASYVQKVRNVTVNGTLSNATSMSTVKKEDNIFSLPTSRLDSKSLTFSINPLVGSGCSYANDFFGGETPEELTESLDGSTAMLQDLERNWKDAARISIQQNEVSSQINMSEFENGCSRRLTRSAFTKTLLEREMEMDNQLPPSPVKQCPSLLPTALNSSANRSSVFDVRGLSRLKESFSVLDHSVKDVQMGREKGIKTLINILSSQSVSTSLLYWKM